MSFLKMGITNRLSEQKIYNRKFSLLKEYFKLRKIVVSVIEDVSCFNDKV